MKGIKSLLQRFRNFTPPGLFIKNKISEVVEAIVGLKIENKNISFDEKKGIVFLKVSGLERTTIFLKKENIIKEVNQIIGKNLVKDIR